MVSSIWHECLCYATYYAPRGTPRLTMLGESISQRYLSSRDQLIGVIGESGTGKSSLVRGMFPGLELTNDDAGINIRPVPLLRMYYENHFTSHTFHIDARFEAAFTQPFEIAEAIRAALKKGHRVIVEHFEFIYPFLNINAQFLMGIGEDIVVARPNVFGPFPDDIVKAVAGTAVYRKMAHTAEDITSMILEKEFGLRHPEFHSDVPRGFVIEFEERPELDIPALERKVKDLIRQVVPIGYHDEAHVRIGTEVYGCTGPRIHVANSGQIENFRLKKELVYDEITGYYCLAGLVGEPRALSIGRRVVEVPESVRQMPDNSNAKGEWPGGAGQSPAGPRERA